LEPCLNETLLFKVDPNDLLLMKEIIIYNLRRIYSGENNDKFVESSSCIICLPIFSSNQIKY
jgi:hypothetical protein